MTQFRRTLPELVFGARGRALRSGLVWSLKAASIIMLMWALVMLVYNYGYFAKGGCERKSRGGALGDVIRMVQAIEQFKSKHQDRCPRDAHELKTAGEVVRDPRDPWDRPFGIECSDAGIRVCSRGPDEADPDDDVCDEKRPDPPTPARGSRPTVAPMHRARIDLIKKGGPEKCR